MDHLFSHLDKLKEDIKNKFVLLFLDYDGTLTPIVRDPDRAVMPGRTRETLRRLSENPDCRIAVISGRALKDVRHRVGLGGVIYAGNHGLEMEGPRIKFRAPVTLSYKAALKEIKRALSKKFSRVKGVFVEDKGLTLTLHYRSADKKVIPAVKTIFRETVMSYLVGGGIRIGVGKMSFEVRPSLEWDKGKMVLWLLARRKFMLGTRPFIAFYIGDDTTDEDAFRALRNRGVGVFVGGPKASLARYRLNNSAEAAGFLRQVLKLKEGAGICRN
ncbi:MAG: trehalose-phosphatase [Candidatus Omnitrophota bacterium]